MSAATEATDRRLALRALLVAVGSIGLIITGLLGMHVFSADGHGHGSPSAHVAVQGISQAPQSAPDESAAGETVLSHLETTSGSSSPAAPGHIDLVTACILALLLSFVLLLPSARQILSGFLARSRDRSAMRTRTKVPASTRPLLLYSISRT